MTTVRVRGVYATALTEHLAAVADVVDASPPIRERFDRSFPTAEPAVTVTTTDDRQGLAVVGEPEGVTTVREQLETVAVDTLAWEMEAPPDAVAVGRVTDTTGGGAVLELGDTEGYLPFDRAEGYVETGDERRVRVDRPSPPWSDDRPVLATSLAVSGTLAGLERGVAAMVAGAPGGDTALARTTELLDPDLPAGWGVRWRRPATDAGMDALGEALERLTARAERVERALTDDGDTDADAEALSAPARVATPLEGVWVRLGRAGRFALDDVRRTVTPTIDGHHRVKAGGRSASDAVDFAERLGARPDGFPTAAVLEQFGPAAGDRVRIAHGKPDGRAYDLGRGEVVERDAAAGELTVERTLSGGGTYDALEVPREAGDVATTRFREGRWWYATTYRGEDGTVRGTYLNVNTPLELYPDAVRYVDLHLDVVKWPDGTVRVVDADELEAAVAAGDVPEALADRARSVASRVAEAVRDA